MQTITKNTLNELADALIEKLQKRSDPFCRPIVVTPNSRSSQWFKAYFLKHSDQVLMNVSFISYAAFARQALKADDSSRLLGSSELRSYLLEELTGNGVPFNVSERNDPLNYICLDDQHFNGTTLFEFADHLARLFTEYDQENREPLGWQKDLYNKALKRAEKYRKYPLSILYRNHGNEPFTFNAPVYLLELSPLCAIYRKIIEQTANATLFSLNESEVLQESTDILEAPSLLREVEAVHSDLCTKLKGNGSLRFNDFLIYAPDIHAYANALKRVFNQDDHEYPSIPLTIVHQNETVQNLKEVLELLEEVAGKHFFTREDLYRFAVNPMITALHGLDYDEIQNWMSVMDATGTHRNGKDAENLFRDDWDYFTKRLLVSKLVSERSDMEACVQLKSEKVLPYASMTLDDEAADRLLTMIGLLKGWLKLFDGGLNETWADRDKQQAIEKQLREILHPETAETTEWTAIYQPIERVFEELAEHDETFGMPAKTLMQIIQNSLQENAIYPASMFTKGVTCLNLNYEDVYSADYVYVMGLSSKAFPRLDHEDELRIHPKPFSSEELDQMALNKLLANNKNVYFSYVGSDLKKDEHFYPSPLLKINDHQKIALDETREYEELFTRKEFKAKRAFLSLDDKAASTSESAFRPTPAGSSGADKKATFSLKEVVQLFKNAFLFRYNSMLKTYEDGQQEITEEFEPIDIGGLKRYKVQSEMILSDEREIAEKLKLEQKLPGVSFGDALFENYAEIVRENRLKLAGYEKVSLPPLSLKDEDGDPWNLVCGDSFYREETSERISYYNPMVFRKDRKDKPELKSYLDLFVFALMDLAKRHEDTTYHITLQVLDEDRSFTMSPKAARERLNDIYALMSRPDELAYMDVELLEKCVKGGTVLAEKCPENLNELNKEIENHSWQYFKDRKMISIFTDFGYDEDGFKDAFTRQLQKLAELIREIN